MIFAPLTLLHAKSSGAQKQDGMARRNLSSHARRRPSGSAAPRPSAFHSTYQAAATKFISSGGRSSISFSPAMLDRNTLAAFSKSSLRKSSSAAKGWSQYRSISSTRSSASNRPENAKHLRAEDIVRVLGDALNMPTRRVPEVGSSCLSRDVEDGPSRSDQLGFHRLAHARPDAHRQHMILDM